MDDTTRSIIRNVKGPGKYALPLPLPLPRPPWSSQAPCRFSKIQKLMVYVLVREDDILCLLESEREARRLR